jgi:hypothetical protein
MKWRMKFGKIPQDKIVTSPFKGPNMKCKLTTQDMKTMAGTVNEVKWEIGKWVTAKGSPNLGLCSTGYIHWYNDPIVAILLNPLHAHIRNPRLWEVETKGIEVEDNGLKFGSTELRLIQELTIPTISIEQYIKIALLCVKSVCSDQIFDIWLNNWIANVDRSLKAKYYILDYMHDMDIVVNDTYYFLLQELIETSVFVSEKTNLDYPPDDTMFKYIIAQLIVMSAEAAQMKSKKLNLIESVGKVMNYD